MTTIPHVAFVGSTKTVTTAKDWCRRVAVPGTCFTLHASSNTGGTCAKKATKFTATKNRVIVHHDSLWPAAVAGIREKHGRHCQMGDFAIKASANSLPTSKLLQQRYGETIVDDITCPLCGSGTDTIEHLLCECPTTQHARDKIYNQLVCTIARITNLTTKKIERRVRSCWKGTKKRSMASPMMELTYVGFLTLEFRQQMLHMGLTANQVERIGRDTAAHALRVTYNLMWKVRNAAMKAEGRTLAGYLRRAGKVKGVAPDRPHGVTGTTSEAIQRMRMKALEAVQEGRPLKRQGERTYPNGTVLWIEPTSQKGVGVYDGGQGDGATVKIKAGRYQYIIQCIRIAGTDNYVTTDREGGKPICYTHVQIGPMLVHTRAMFSKHEWSTGQMRKAAVKFDGRTAVVWSTKVNRLTSSQVLLYDGSNTLISTTDEDIATKQKWLNAAEYDSQTRDEIDALWENVEKKDLWFMLGARMKRLVKQTIISQTIISHEEDQWTLANDKEAEEVCDDNELMTRIHKCGVEVKWTSVEGKRDARPIERAIGQKWAQIKAAAKLGTRAIRAAMRLNPSTTDTTGRATARPRT